MFSKNKPLLIFLFSFFISRVIFITTSPVMFDSQEYIRRFSESNLFTAITSGHIPFHSGYTLLFWPIYHLAKFINLNPLYSMQVAQVILATFSIYFFYKTIEILFDKKIGMLASIIFSLIPIYWITNVTIMMETTYISFFIFSLYLLTAYLKNKNKSYILLSSACFGFSFFTQFSVILWIPFLIYLMFILNKKLIYKISIYYLLSLLFFGITNAGLLALASNRQLASSIYIYFFSLKDTVPINLSMSGMFIYFRNFIIPLLRNNTNLVVLLAFISLIKLYFSKSKMFWLFLLFMAPAILLNQSWDSLLFGRHALIVGLGLATLVAILISKNVKLFYLLLIYLLIITLPQIFRVNNAPYLNELSTLSALPKGLLIRSHFERPYTQGFYKGQFANTTDGGLEMSIDSYLKNNQKIFITSAAISDPYGLYSGSYVHNLSLSYKNSYLLQGLLTKYSIKEYQKINTEDNLIIYQIIKKENSPYPNVKNMRYSMRRLDFFDPISQAWLFIDKKLNLSRFL